MANEFFGCATVVGTRNEIIGCLYSSAPLEAAIRNICKSNNVRREYCEELKSELFLHLCELTEHELCSIFFNGYLDYYLLRTLENMFISGGSFFQKSIKKHIASRSRNDIDWCKVAATERVYIDPDAALSLLNWFEQEIASLYSKHKSIPKIAEITGVSEVYAYGIFKEAKKKIKTYASGIGN